MADTQIYLLCCQVKLQIKCCHIKYTQALKDFSQTHNQSLVIPTQFMFRSSLRMTASACCTYQSAFVKISYVIPHRWLFLGRLFQFSTSMLLPSFKSLIPLQCVLLSLHIFHMLPKSSCCFEAQHSGSVKYSLSIDCGRFLVYNCSSLELFYVIQFCLSIHFITKRVANVEILLCLITSALSVHRLKCFFHPSSVLISCCCNILQQNLWISPTKKDHIQPHHSTLNSTRSNH